MAYFVFVLMLSILLFLHEYSKKLGFFNINYIKNLVFLLLFLFSALRYNVGYDYGAYVYRISILNPREVSYFMREFFSYILLVLANISQNPQVYFALNSLITIVLIHKTIKNYSSNYVLSIWIFVMFPMFYLNSFTIVRHFSAVAVIFYSIRYIDENNFKKFLLCVLVATLFHNSAIFFLPIYYLSRISFKTKDYLLTAIAIIFSKSLIQFTAVKVLPKFLSDYVVVTTPLFAGRGTIIVITIFTIISLLFKESLIKKNKLNEIYINSMFFAVVIYLTFMQYGHFPFRITLYLYIFLVILIPDIVFVFKEKLMNIMLTKDRKYIRITNSLNIAIYLSFLVMFIYMIKSGGDYFNPYKLKIFKFGDPSYFLEYLSVFMTRNT